MSIADEIKNKEGDHILICGQIQQGKQEEKKRIAARFIQEGYPVVQLFRPYNIDYVQYEGRTPDFNRRQKLKNAPLLPLSHSIKANLHRLDQLFDSGLPTPNFALGLANLHQLNPLNKYLSENPDTKKPIVILDEADLICFDLVAENPIKAEQAVKELFANAHMIISVTATPGCILLCDRFDQIYTLETETTGNFRYFGIDEVYHEVVTTIKPERGSSQQYNPQLDRHNLQRVVDALLATPHGALLINPSYRCNDHREVIQYLSKEYKNNENVKYLEVNQKSVKIYDHCGEYIREVSSTNNGSKTADVAKAMHEYADVPYLIIVAGVLAGRGVSFNNGRFDESVGVGGFRHLTHQYLASPGDKTNLENAMQAVRLLGKYPKGTKLKLYCSESLKEDLKKQHKTMREFIQIAKAARVDGQFMPEILETCAHFAREWFAPRKMKGIDYRKHTKQNTGIVHIFRSEDRDKIAPDYAPNMDRKFNTAIIDFMQICYVQEKVLKSVRPSQREGTYARLSDLLGIEVKGFSFNQYVESWVGRVKRKEDNIKQGSNIPTEDQLRILHNNGKVWGITYRKKNAALQKETIFHKKIKKVEIIPIASSDDLISGTRTKRTYQRRRLVRRQYNQR